MEGSTRVLPEEGGVVLLDGCFEKAVSTLLVEFQNVV